MKRILLAVAGGALLGSVVTLTLVLWIHGGLPRAVAQGEPAGARINGDVNGDGLLNIADPVYLCRFLFSDGPTLVPMVCPPNRLPATGQTKCYNYLGEIPCDGAEFPGQDGFYHAGCPNEGRFIDNGDGTVTDTCTGLMWQQDTADTRGDGSIGDADELDWHQGLQYCEDLTFAGYDDWRLPNVRELQSIVDHGRRVPAIDPVFGCVSDWYFSSSTIAGKPETAWGVDFIFGHCSDGGGKAFPYIALVRAVRTIQPGE